MKLSVLWKFSLQKQWDSQQHNIIIRNNCVLGWNRVVACIMQGCYMGVTRVSYWCCSVVTGVLEGLSQECYTGCYMSFTTILHECFMSFRMVLQGCYKVLHRCYTSIARVLLLCYRGGFYRGFTLILQGCYRGATDFFLSPVLSPVLSRYIPCTFPVISWYFIATFLVFSWNLLIFPVLSCCFQGNFPLLSGYLPCTYPVLFPYSFMVLSRYFSSTLQYLLKGFW